MSFRGAFLPSGASCPGPYIRQFAGYPRIGGTAQDIHVTPGSGDPGSRPSAAQSRPELSMATRPGQRTLEAARGNGYAPVRGTAVMMTMMELHAKTGHKQDSQKELAPSHCSSLC